MGRVTIKAEEYQLVGSESDRGVSIELSPYDLPREVEASFDKHAGVLHLTFKYVDEEEAVSKEMRHSLKMKVGKHSGKILGFEIPVTERNIKKVELQLDEAIDSALPTLRRFNQKANFKVVKSILDRKRDPIFSSLAAAGA
jgi:hypothetical protein